jgi:hypothetical protein
MRDGDPARISRQRKLPARLSVMALFGSLIAGFTSPAARAAPIGSWTLWASAQNGVVAGNYPKLAISPATHELYYSYYIRPSSNTDPLGTVWQCSLNDPTRTFSLMPQTGLVLPPRPATGGVPNVFSLTTSAAGEPIVGCTSLNNYNTSTKMYRFDTASNQWVAPTLTAYAGQNIPVLNPYEAMYSLTRGPNGTIWGGGQFGLVYRSTDNGKTFTVLDESKLLAQTDPAYYPTRNNGAGNDGAVYSIRVAPSGVVYAGTESAGVIYSPDNGTTWHPLDYDYTNLNSTMGRATNVGNVAGLGFMASGKIVIQGAPGQSNYPPQDASHVDLYLADPASHTIQTAGTFSQYFFGGQQVSQIVTDSNGTLFLHSNIATITSGGTAQPGGIFTSTDGLNWSEFNSGIASTFYLSASNQWIDTNGHGAEGSLVVDGNNVYMATTDGNIWEYTDAVPEPSSAALLAMIGMVLAAGRPKRRWKVTHAPTMASLAAPTGTLRWRL